MPSCLPLIFTFGQTARHGQDQGHRHVGRVFREDAGRIGHHDVVRAGGMQVDMVHAIAEIGDQLEPVADLCDQRSIDMVCNRGDQHVAVAHGVGQRVPIHGSVADIEADVEQGGHPAFDSRRQAPGHDDARIGRADASGHGADFGQGQAKVKSH